MAENVVLTVFVLLPVLGVASLWLFFTKLRLHRSPKHRVPLLIAGNVLVLLTLASFCLPFGEIYYRWIYDASDSYGLMKTHQKWMARHFHQNLEGWRDTVPQYPLRKIPGRKRLILLGDSFTADQGINRVEDTLGFLLRKKLPDWDIQIHAFCGWDTADEILELALLAQNACETDAILLVYCLNDIGPLVPQWTTVLESVQGDSAQPGFFVRNSYLLSVLYYRTMAFFRPELGQYFGFLSDSYVGGSWERQRSLLTKLTELATKGLNAKILVCTFPIFSSSPDGRYRFAEAHESLHQFWTELKVPNLDLRSAYEGQRLESMTVNRHDSHPNERAIAIAADEIASFLRKNLGGG